LNAGSLAERDFAEVVKDLSQRRFCGRLFLEKDAARIVISVDDGRLVFATSSDPDHRLGPLLLRRGAITLRQMMDAGPAMKGGKRFGTVLVEQGVLDPKELVRGVVDHTRDVVLQAFRWTSGEYRLEEGKGAGESITLSISTPQLILDGIAQIDAWSRVERGSGGLSAHYAPLPGAEPLFRQLTLDVDQAALLRSVKGERDVEALCAASALNHFEVCRNLWAFRVIGLVRRLEHATPFDDDGLEYIESPGSP
jgi:hypothetical protein